MIFRIAGLVLIALMGYGIYLSYQENIAGLYLGWSLLVVFGSLGIIETALREENLNLKGGKLIPSGETLSRLSEAITNASKTKADHHRQLMEKLDSLLEAIPASARTGAEVIKAVEANAESMKQENAALLKAAAASSGDLQRELMESQKKIVEQLQEQSAGLKREVLEHLNTSGEDQDSAADQAALIAEISQKLSEAAGKLEKSNHTLEEAGSLSLANQTELQASVEMLNTGLTQILEKWESKVGASEKEDLFVEKLHRTLEAFHERATDILIENSLKTREILIGGNAEQQ